MVDNLRLGCGLDGGVAMIQAFVLFALFAASDPVKTEEQEFSAVVEGRKIEPEQAIRAFDNDEASHVPGSMGDPFHVVTALPGVSATFSLLPVPAIRGSSPAGTGFLLDGMRVPMLFHLLAGPAVVHPRFIDSVTVYPGGFSTRYGGYIGGIIDGKTRDIEKKKLLIDAQADSTSSSLYVSTQLPRNVRIAASGRYGYPGVFLRLFEPGSSYSYYDYQVRVEGELRNQRWSLSLLGAGDKLQRSQKIGVSSFVDVQFHRLLLKHAWEITPRLRQESQMIFSFDRAQSDPQGKGTSSFGTEARILWMWQMLSWIDVEAGIQGFGRSSRDERVLGASSGGFFEEVPIDDPKVGLGSVGAFVEATLVPLKGLRVTPGARVDAYFSGDTQKVSADGRLRAWYCAWGKQQCLLAVKASTGTFHQPPRLLVAVPGLDFLALNRGLLQSFQNSAGIEARLPGDFLFELQGYYNRMDPLGYEPRLAVTLGSSQIPPTPNAALHGRSYGAEVLLRSMGLKRAFGWVGYTWSKSERSSGDSWYPYDFDRRHQVTLVAGVRLPRDWRFSMRGMYQSGVPVDTERGRSTSRAPGFVRFDVRVDKTFVWRDFNIDFYLDVANVTLSREVGGLAGTEGFRYIFPSLGIKVLL